MNIDKIRFNALKQSEGHQNIQDELSKKSLLKIFQIDHLLRDKPLKIAYSQQYYWRLEQNYSTMNLSNHLSLLLSLEGELIIPVLEKALELLIEHHEILRSQFRLHNGEPHQLIIPVENYCLSFAQIDLSQHLFKAQTLKLDEILKSESESKLDLTMGPLFHILLIKRSDDNYLLLLKLHRIIVDSYSVNLLLDDLAVFYKDILTKRKTHLTPHKLSFADYANWQQQPATIQRLEQSTSYWQQQLKGAPELLSLPTKTIRPNKASFNVAHYEFKLANIILKHLQPCVAQPEITLFIKLAALWSILLSYLSGQDEVVLGIPVKNRAHAELEQIVGPFSHHLALRVPLKECETFNDVLQIVHRNLSEGYLHQALPFERLLESLNLTPNTSYHPLFQVEISLNSHTLVLPSFNGLKISQTIQPYNRSRLDLKLAFTENTQGLSAEIEYASDLFERNTIKQMVGYFKQLLRAMLNEPMQLFRTVAILSPIEQQRIVRQFNATSIAAQQNDLIHVLIEQQAKLYPERIALEFGTELWSYAALNCAANRLAYELIIQGVKPNTRIAICVERSPAMLIGLLAILKAGGAYIPLDLAYPVKHLDNILRDAAPLILLTQRHLGSIFKVGIPQLLIDDYLSQEQALSFQNRQSPIVTDLTPQHLAYIIYTSGSTGQAKGVMVPHRGLVHLVNSQKKILGMTSESRVLQFASLSFAAYIWEYAMALSSGSTLVLTTGNDLISGQALGETLTQQRITHALLPPVVASALPEAFTLPDLNTLVISGDVCSVALVQRFAAERTLLNAYGATECTVCSAIYSCNPTDRHEPAIGRPVANTQIYILDSAKKPVPVGVTGEIYIGGEGIADGYFGDPELTAEYFIADPFSEVLGARLYRSGDLGCWRADGQIEYQGRNDFKVKLSGFRVEFGEIETRLLQYEGVKEALVVASGTDLTQQSLLAYIITDVDQASPTPTGLHDYLAQHLADYMLPSAFILLEHFPLTANGKIDRSALPEPDNNAVVRAEYHAPQGLAEQHLAEIWQQLLGIAQVGRYDNFFELGGSSLLIVGLIEKLRRVGAKLGVPHVFAEPILYRMAQYLSSDAHILPE